MNEFLETQGKESQEQLGKINLEKLREKHREEQSAYRENQREFILKKARFIQDDESVKNLNDCDVTTLAKSLKIKSQVTCGLLSKIMNALLNDENIAAFLKIDGALQALLRLLSGQNEKFQLIAAQCICNLALGNEKQSLQVLKASETYLMMHLSGRNCYVTEACVIALGNLSRQSPKNVELLTKQGFIPKILNILKNEDSNLEAAAIYSLSQLIYHGFNIIRPEELEKCLLGILHIFKKRSFSVAFLMSLLSSSAFLYPHFISSNVHVDAINYSLISLNESEKHALYFLRILSNLINEDSGVVGKKLIENHSYIIRDCVTHIFKSEKKYLIRECLGLVGNLLNHPVEMLRLFGVEIVKENFEFITLYKKKLNSFFDKMAV